ncbi:hypothetical protein [Micromonospora sp. NPDC023633]
MIDRLILADVLRHVTPRIIRARRLRPRRARLLAAKLRRRTNR